MFIFFRIYIDFPYAMIIVTAVTWVILLTRRVIDRYASMPCNETDLHNVILD